MLVPFTIFLGSFLLFGVQPLVGRTLLPAFGGTSSEWVVCLCAFQTLLIAGYFLAHFASGAPHRRRIHVALLFVSAVWVFFAYAGWKSFGRGLVGGPLPPGVEVLLCVLALCGLPYALLSANSSLVQACVASRGRRGVYRLYGVSNAGSLAGLLAYPLVLEPYVPLTAQWRGFGVGVAIYAALLAALVRRTEPMQNAQCAMHNDGRAVARRTRRHEDTKSFNLATKVAKGSDGRDEERPSRNPMQNAKWRAISYLRRHGAAVLAIALPALSCFLLNAVTTHLTLDVMPMPMLWALLLAVFLASYIAGFTSWAERNVALLALLSLATLCGVCWATAHEVSLPAAMGTCFAFLAAACTFLHAWLYGIRPEANQLTRYYLLSAVGGAFGGVFASLVAPLVFDRVLEFPLAALVTGFFSVVAASGVQRVQNAEHKTTHIFHPLSPIPCLRGRSAAILAVLLLVAACALYLSRRGNTARTAVHRSRGFFGTIQVLESRARTSIEEGYIREFVHGTTVHGIQALIPGRERMPTTYYTPNACGYAIVAHPKYRRGEPMRVNFVGLGIGVMFCYGRTNDYYRAYEISEEVLAVATDTNLFTFVADCPARKEIVLGDARKGLEDELRRGVEPYDMIVVDAFTGDNLPYHLSTWEAFELYFKLLKPDGVLCVNISNWHLQLEPFMRALGESFGVPLLGLHTNNDFGQLAFAAKAAFFCRKPEGLAMPPVGPKCRIINFNAFKSMPRLPTDEKGSFLGLIR